MIDHANLQAISNAAREMYDGLVFALSGLGKDGEQLAEAFAVARDAIDMYAMPPEIVVDIVTGQRPLYAALRDAAEVQADNLDVQLEGATSDEEREEIRASNTRLVAMLGDAANTIERART